MRESEHRMVYDAVKEVWLDTSDSMDETFDEWAHWMIRTEAFEPAMWFWPCRRRARRLPLRR